MADQRLARGEANGNKSVKNDENSIVYGSREHLAQLRNPWVCVDDVRRRNLLSSIMAKPETSPPKVHLPQFTLKDYTAFFTAGEPLRLWYSRCH
jgi:hypothetical protein